MIDIGTTEFFIDVQSLTEDELEQYSNKIFDELEEYVRNNLTLPDYSISLEIEEGSIKGRNKIAIAAATFYFGIGHYGSFIQGLQIIGDQLKTVSDVLIEKAERPFPSIKANKKRGGALVKLQKLFDKVQNGDLTSKQAMLEAEKILGDDAASSPELMSELQSALENAPRYPQQIPLPYLDIEDGYLVEKSKKQRRNPSHPKPVIPEQQLRVEIWRSSKKDKKNVKVTKT